MPIRRLMAGVLAGMFAVTATLTGCSSPSSWESKQPMSVPSENVTTDERTGDLNYLVLVNKETRLPEGWESKVVLVEAPNPMGDEGSGPIPMEMRTYDAFLALQKDVAKDGVDIELDSGYRSVAQQQRIWDDFTEEYVEDYVREHVAVPGYSEYHTGLAIDLYLVIGGKNVYENEEMMKHQELWDKVHAKLADHGFILRFPSGKEDVTGYDYEPWHIRYVGSPEVAHDITDRHMVLEEYLDAGKKS